MGRQADARNASNHAETAGISDGDKPDTYLATGGMKCTIDSTNSFESQTEMLEGQTDVSRAQTDTSNVSNGAETDTISHGESAGTYLGARDVKHNVNEMDGFGSHANASSGYTDTQAFKQT